MTQADPITSILLAGSFLTIFGTASYCMYKLVQGSIARTEVEKAYALTEAAAVIKSAKKLGIDVTLEKKKQEIIQKSKSFGQLLEEQAIKDTFGKQAQKEEQKK